MDRVSLPPLHSTARPLTTPGVAGAGADTATVKICAEDVPQLLCAVTDTVPPVAPAVAMIELVVDVPLHPDGSDHV